MKVPFVDLTRANQPIEAELEAAFRRVMRSGRFVLGEEVEAFEAECARYLGVKHAVGVSSGTDALIVALMALGVGAGDEVICPAYSFVATAEAIVRVGATPVFVDVEPDTLLLDLAAAARHLGPRTRAILPVHLFGRCVDVAGLARLAPGVPIVEDAAQAFGATEGGGRAGTSGTLGCFSFVPTKPLGAMGDGGMVVTDDHELAARARLLRVHGARRRGEPEMIGGNFRLDELQAALLRSKLPHVEAWTEARRRVARNYGESLAPLARSGRMTLPPMGEGDVWHQYVVRCTSESARTALRAHLSASGVETATYYPRPLHELRCYGARAPTCHVAAGAARTSLALPMFAGLRDDELSLVVGGICTHLGGRA
ncbi:MAG: DegT/DnrJ/EryC1/StrS family aminotransferase [Polyangiales bacterium]